MNLSNVSILKAFLITGLALLISGCATRTERFEWVAVGGSKADGNVILGIDVPPINGVVETIVEQDPEQANAEADRRCKNWGYGGAEMFRAGQFPVQKICHPQGISPCWSKTYRLQYQCVDKKSFVPKLEAPRDALPIHRIHHSW